MSIIIISQREEIVKVINSISGKQVKTINSSEEAVSFLNKNNPALIILDLEVEDLNIFVAHELLKVCKSVNNSVVIIVTSEKTENEIDSYKKLIHPPDEFIKDTEIIINLDNLLKKYSISSINHKTKHTKEIEDEKIFADEINADIDELDIFNNELLKDDGTNQGIFTVSDAKDHSGEINFSIDDSSEIAPNDIKIEKIKKENTEKKKSRNIDAEKIALEKNMKISELNAEIISLEKQNEFMKKENKDLLIQNNKLKQSSETHKQNIDKITLEMKNLNTEVEAVKIATKETIENKDKEIKDILNNHQEEINNFNSEIEQSKSDKKILEASLMDEIGLLKSNNKELEKEREKIFYELESLKTSFLKIEKKLEKETIEIENLKKEIETIEKAKDEKEKILISSIDHLKKNITVEEEKNAEQKEKLDKINDISKSLSEVVKN